METEEGKVAVLRKNKMKVTRIIECTESCGKGETVQWKYAVMDERVIKYSGKRGKGETVT